MEKKKYNSLEIDIVLMAMEDIVRTSSSSDSIDLDEDETPWMPFG